MLVNFWECKLFLLQQIGAWSSRVTCTQSGSPSRPWLGTSTGWVKGRGGGGGGEGEVRGWKSLNCKIPNVIGSTHWSTYSNWFEYVAQFTCDLCIKHMAHRHERVSYPALISCATSAASVLRITCKGHFQARWWPASGRADPAAASPHGSAAQERETGPEADPIQSACLLKVIW